MGYVVASIKRMLFPRPPATNATCPVRRRSLFSPASAVAASAGLSNDHHHLPSHPLLGVAFLSCARLLSLFVSGSASLVGLGQHGRISLR